MAVEGPARPPLPLGGALRPGRSIGGSTQGGGALRLGLRQVEGLRLAGRAMAGLEATALRIQQAVMDRTGISISIGGATGRTLAKMAASCANV